MWRNLSMPKVGRRAKRLLCIIVCTTLLLAGVWFGGRYIGEKRVPSGPIGSWAISGSKLVYNESI
jgi:hypothetical protein